jgi:hypothetical protein
MNELNQSFMYSQLFKEILLDLPDDKKIKNELVDFCREQYINNDDEFEEKYDQSSSIW